MNEVQLLPPVPNPAHTQTAVRYTLPSRQGVRVRLYDLLGRRVRTIVQAEQEGRHEHRLDVSPLSSGVYVLRLRTENTVRTRTISVVQ